MPVQRLSVGFKDVSASFKINPISDDLIVLNNERAIARSVRNLIMTVPGEKPFNPTIGSRVTRLLFDPMDEITSNAIRGEIEFTIEAFEPRVKLRKVEVTPNHDEQSYDVKITYTIIGIEVEPQQLEFALELTR